MFTPLSKWSVISLALGAFIALQAADAPVKQGPLGFKAYDQDKNGVISREEFDDTRSKLMQKRAEEGRPMRNAGNAPTFEFFDADGDGGITPAELREGRQKRQEERRGAKQKPN